MSIKVKHGSDISSLVKLAMLVGASKDKPQFPGSGGGGVGRLGGGTVNQSGGGGGGGGGGGRGGGVDDYFQRKSEIAQQGAENRALENTRASNVADALWNKNEYDKDKSYNELKMDQFRQRSGTLSQKAIDSIAAIQEKAKFDEANFEKRYTAKDKAELVKWQSAPDLAAASGQFNEEELMKIKRMSAEKIAGITPKELPRLSSNPKGQDPGQSWIDPETGAMVMKKVDGNVGMLVRPRETIQGMAAEYKYKMDAAVLEQQHKRENAIDLFRQKMASEPIQGASDAQGKATMRARNAKEVQEAVDAAYPQAKQVKAAPQQSQPQQQSYQVKPGGLSASGAFKWDGKKWIPNKKRK